MISERIKYLNYSNSWTNYWYWRTKEQNEIDFVEESNGKLMGYEFKWNPNSKIKKPKLFLNTYDNASFNVIHKENFESFLLE